MHMSKGTETDDEPLRVKGPEAKRRATAAKEKSLKWKKTETEDKPLPSTKDKKTRRRRERRRRKGWERKSARQGSFGRAATRRIARGFMVALSRSAAEDA
jgi:hypothetical protein